jgi:predicted  nucleic acid-binding Zn-ribbon protein
MTLVHEVVQTEMELQRLEAARHDSALRDARRVAKQAIVDLEKQIDILEAASIAATARAEELAGEQAELSTRLRRVRSADGTSDYRQATQIEHELEVLTAKLDAVEEAELELMEQSEERQTRLGVLAEELATKRQELALLLADQERQQLMLTDAIEAKAQELNALIDQLDATTSAAIRAARDRGAIPALAFVHGGYCGNCHMALSNALRGRVVTQQATLQRCEECGVLLVAEDEGDR